MIRKGILISLLAFATTSLQAQWQASLFGGLSNYEGDLVDRAYISNKGAGEISLGYAVNRKVVIRGGLAFAKVAGADSLSRHIDLKQRNLSFQSPITEFNLIAEFSPFSLDEKRWTPYFFGGIAVFHFNPYTFDKSGNQYFLQPLSTEGQGITGYKKPYSRTAWALPFGAGLRFTLSEKFALGAEVGVRKTSTDYLDDVSGDYADPAQLLAAKGAKAVELSYRGGEIPGGNSAYPAKGYPRGSPKYKDYYYFSGIRLTYYFPGSGRSGWNGSGSSRSVDCPRTPQ